MKDKLENHVNAIHTWNPTTAASDKEFRYIDLSAIDAETKHIVAPRTVLACDAPSRARQLVQTGDVLVSTVRPNLNGVARVPADLNLATASTGFTVLRANEKSLSGAYLFHWVQSEAFVEDMIRKATGASYPAVSDRIVLDSLIPLAPLPEQQRIAAILDQAEALQAKRRQVLAKLDTLTQSLFLEMFGDPMSNPYSLERTTLGRIVKFVGGGTPSRADPSYFEGTICWATPKDMRGAYLKNTEEHITARAIDESATNLVAPGAILVVVKSKVLMRRLPILISDVPVCFGQDIKAIVPSQGWPSAFLAQHIKSLQRHILRQARGINTEGLTLDHLSELPILMPGDGARHDFSHFVKKVRCIDDACQAQYQKMAEQMSALQRIAFN